MQTALIIGATGMVGNQLVNLLLQDNRFTKVVVFVRRDARLRHPKLEQRIINFEEPESWRDLVKGSVLFSALGTTIRQAGSKEEQYKVDYSYQYAFAKAAAENGVPVYVLVSSSGANPRSLIFYSRMKGELESEVKKLPFLSINILQPGLLTGHRQHERIGEKIAFRILNGINAIGILKSYRPIAGKTVAEAMINASVSAKQGIQSFTLEKVFELAGK